MMHIACSHSAYHQQVEEVPINVLEGGNKILSDRIHTKVVKENLIFSSYGPWLERHPANDKQYSFKANGKGYRLVYLVGNNLHCLHIGEENQNNAVEIHSIKAIRSGCLIL